MFLRFLASFVATLGVGKIPLAPGTFGSLLALLIWWFVPIHAATIVSVFFIGWVGTHFYERWYSTHDPKEVVVDEVIGMWITLYLAPVRLSTGLMGFIFFRIFDIWKPFPIGWVDRKVPGALGTILDDICAGLLAWVCLYYVDGIMESYGLSF